MAETAESLAEKYKLTRKEVDEVAVGSQQRAKRAWDACVFQDEVIPVTVRVKGKEVEFRADEHMRPETTLEILSTLKPYFKKDGLVTAGNASGIVDGAAAVVVTREATAKGMFAREIEPVPVKIGKELVSVVEDENLKKFNEEKLRTLSPAFGAKGTVTAGNASSINDGAAAVMVVSQPKAQSLGLKAKTAAGSVGPLLVLRARDSEAAVKRLAERDIVVSSRLDGLRFSFHIYNTEDDVKAVLAALEDNRNLLVTEPTVYART